MKTVSAREASEQFSTLLSRTEEGEEVVITRDGLPVAILSPYCDPAIDAERRTKVEHAVALTRKGLPWPRNAAMPTRDEMHER
jgi:prevent-host-death family protein